MDEAIRKDLDQAMPDDDLSAIYTLLYAHHKPHKDAIEYLRTYGKLAGIVKRSRI